MKGHLHHPAFVVGGDDHGEAGQRRRTPGIGAVYGPQHRAQTLEEEHRQGVAGPQNREHGGVGPALQQFPVDLKGAAFDGQSRQGQQHQGDENLNGQVSRAMGWP